jgi:Tol biopolymer transport system component
MRSGRTWHVGVAVFAIVLSAGIPSARGQYFGQNKVQYRKLDFQVLSTEHFDIYFYSRERVGAQQAARLAERWYSRLSRLFDHNLRGRQPLILYASPADFRQTNLLGDVGEGTGGVTESVRRRIIMPLAGSLADTDHVLGHELVHAFQFDVTANPDAAPGQNGAQQLPLWFIEGMAEYFSIGPVDPNTAMWLRDADAQEALPDIKDLANPKYFPYRWGQALWAYIGGRWGDSIIPRLLVDAAKDGDIESTFKKQLGLDLKELSAAWQDSIRDTYRPVLASTTRPADTARLAIAGKGLGGDLNIGPAISPDGSRIAFLSQRGVFSTDLYVADAANGRILRKLTSTATDPHFSSIESLDSSGAWSPDGTRLAIAAMTGGTPELALFNVDRGDREREIDIDDVDQVLNPSWSPDGQRIVFSGMKQGLTDLYVYDLKADQLKPLTDDAYADLQPAWSPDGRQVAFVTDRFTTNLDTLAIGRFEVALIDVASGEIRQIPADAGAAMISPQWSPDGRALYVVSNRGGTPNLYRLDPASGAMTALTDITTGVSGITATSPALSVSAHSGVAAFSVYDDGHYNIYTIETASREPVTLTVSNADALPPATRNTSEVTELTADASTGLPAAQEFPAKPYRSGLKLEGLAQPTVGAGASRFGVALSGGIALQFADMLNNQQLVTAVQFNQTISGSLSGNDLAAQAAYLNQSHRWNWGVTGGQIPYLSGGFSSGIGVTDTGEPVQVDQAIIYRQTERSVGGLAAYPFDRARRVEFQGGMTHVGFEQVVDTTATSLLTGQLIAHDSTTTTTAPPLTLTTTSAAYVFDTASLGPTSPVQGQRYRFQVEPTFGSLNLTSVLGDYRRYFMPVSFYTIAARVMHYGRYGSGGEDPRLFPLYIGYPELVHGYDVNTFTAADCVATAESSCPAFDRLLGSRMLIGNLELRFPLLRPFGQTERMYGPVPVEVALFTDGGVAWNSGESPSFLGGTRHGVSSAGVAFRVNILGFAVGEFAFSRPFQRPGQGWVFQFNLAPGF